ncbi:hypothetical protein N7448_002001 [Penicillium atrosanguineum]|uniref:Uncharacterized protein n=1 Tax=Penicillium atrosanguineum TaxID=1132637 RepID=A0A9W9L8Q2_9EURO|nr:BolA-like protein [Penicillium atrosanguineum]KAJ5128283.1 hypothetical protein N7526_006449 [Penicillium atrosanguineum]KAJ5144609.1 hypothetical protein N7448_002001 [Penicillium atrosanguineum]KAJ5300400.1 BolA-like protein [Penicillium atrosanguineum]KAJ5311038.1 hypothetical protein N7476_006898 [Penicillium atrosanguineum]
MSDYPEPPSHMAMHSQGGASPDNRAEFPMRSHPAATSTEPEDHQVDLKRSRACEPCRQLKVRCDPDLNNLDAPCKRCAKARRTCIVTAPTRKRQKKTDSRVTELERKIDALTATLQQSHSNAIAMAPPAQQSQYFREEQPASGRWLSGDSHVAGNKRSHDELLASQYSLSDSPPTEQIHKPSVSKWRGPFAGETAPPKVEAANEFADVVDKGLIDIETANLAFDHYVNKMAVEMPMVVFRPETTMEDVRRDKPTLFLSIIATAVGKFNKDAQLPLVTETYKVIADRVIIKGEKSLELIQAILVSAIWYLPPDNLEELKFYQLIHMAVVLAMDIGLNRRLQGDLKPFARLRELLIKKPQGPNVDIQGPEARRTWLGCYFMAVQVTTALRRTHLVRWHPYMDDCLQVLETHPDALPSDRQVIWWAKLGFIMEESGVQLLSDDPDSTTSFADSKTRYTIKAFNNQLTQWKKDIPGDLFTIPLAHTFHVVNLFVHESAMSIDCKDSVIPYTPENSDLPASALAPLIDALTTCINAIHQSLDAILSVEPQRLTCLPTVSLARTSYPVVSLIKIYSLLTASESRIGQVIDMQSLKLEWYLEKVINHYRTAAALDAGRAPAKFGNIIMMLRNWFVKKKENGPALREIFGTEMRSDTQDDKPTPQQNQMKQGATPLDLLSEVATGNQSSRAQLNGSLMQRPPSGQGSLYSPATMTQNMSNSPTPGGTTYGPAEAPTTSWSTPSFTPSMSGHTDPNMGSRAYYQPFTPTERGALYTVPSTMGGTYVDMSVNMPLGQMSMQTGLGVEETFDPDNLFALGSMMDEGLFTFPSAFDGNFWL